MKFKQSIRLLSVILAADLFLLAFLIHIHPGPFRRRFCSGSAPDGKIRGAYLR